MLPGDVWVDFISITLSEAKEYMVVGEGDPQPGCQDERAVVELVNDQVDPG